jgi:flagellar protein FliO/FliZ
MTPGTLALTLTALFGVVALILLTRRAALLIPTLRLPGLPGGGGQGRGGALQVEQVIPLDPRRRLLLVRAGTRRVLLLTGGPQDVVVGWLDAPSENPEPSHDKISDPAAAAAK